MAEIPVMQRESVVETTNLTKAFGEFPAVDDVSLNIRAGEIYGFLGLNGAGKTTTIRMLLGLIRPTSGSVWVFGEEIRPGGGGPWDRVGSLVETPSAYPELSVQENLDVFRRLRGIDDRKAVERVIELLGLAPYVDRQARHLSLGNMQRLGIAKAFLHQPQLLLLDEPSNGLDPAGIVEIRELLIGLAKEHSVTIFVSSHILDEVARLATRVGIIHKGRLLREVSASELNALLEKRLLVSTRDNGAAHSVLADNGYSAISLVNDQLELRDPGALDRPDEVAQLLVRHGVPPTLLFRTQENLETYFLRITGEGREGPAV